MEAEFVLLVTRSILGSKRCAQALGNGKIDDPEAVVRAVSASAVDLPPGWTPAAVADLARLDLLHHFVMNAHCPGAVDVLSVNPSLEIARLSWDPAHVLDSGFETPPSRPVPTESWVMGWRNPETGEPRFIKAGPGDLLAVKLVVEAVDRLAEAVRCGVPVARLDSVVSAAVEQGILMAPPSRIRRNTPVFHAVPDVPPQFLVSETFTIQWHITNACDLHCRHCYDRTLPSLLTLDEGLHILDDLWRFCRNYGVRGHVCLTGGNPFMHPDFVALYRAASERDFYLSILGNPTPRSRVEEVVDIQMPEYFQVSLEGLSAHNDFMRGSGHFSRTLRFLHVLRDLGIPSQVMLTLTRDNMDQILPLTERLRGLVDDFTFNRLSQVGEGADLPLPDREEYAAFLRAYVDAAAHNPIMAWKDNLLNIVRLERGMGLFGGCTGFGCGAAFNFVAVLPDGEVHACRKFPSRIGRVPGQTLAEVYESAAAARYRRGCSECDGCEVRPVCGGCLAIASGHGLHVFTHRDPMCFIDHQADRAEV